MMSQRLMHRFRSARQDNGAPPPRGTLGLVVRDAVQFDRRAISVQAGLLAAIPVVAVLGIGSALWSSVAGVTMGAGAMLVGIAWRVGGGRPPIALLATDATVMAISTFVGCVTGSVVVAALRPAGGLGAGGRAAGGARKPRWGRRDAGDDRVRRVRAVQPARRARRSGSPGSCSPGASPRFCSKASSAGRRRCGRQRAATADAYRALSGLASASTEMLDIAGGGRARRRSGRAVVADAVRRSRADDAAQPGQRGTPDAGPAERDPLAGEPPANRGRPIRIPGRRASSR